MLANCPVCGYKLEPGSRFCRQCGASVMRGDVRRGRNITRVALVFCGVLPGVVAVVGLVLMLATRSFSLLTSLDVLLVAVTLSLFALLYRGQAWTVGAIGWMIIVLSLAELGLILMRAATDDLAAVTAALRALFGVYFLLSKDVRAFAEWRKGGGVKEHLRFTIDD